MHMHESDIAEYLQSGYKIDYRESEGERESERFAKYLGMRWTEIGLQLEGGQYIYVTYIDENGGKEYAGSGCVLPHVVTENFAGQCGAGEHCCCL